MLGLNFKTWLEGISHQEARKIVLDAVGAADADSEAQGHALTGTLEQHPDLVRKLSAYTALQPHLANVEQYITDNQKSTIVELISYLASLDDQELPSEREDLGDKDEAVPVV